MSNRLAYGTVGLLVFTSAAFADPYSAYEAVCKGHLAENPRASEVCGCIVRNIKPQASPQEMEGFNAAQSAGTDDVEFEGLSEFEFQLSEACLADPNFQNDAQ